MASIRRETRACLAPADQQRLIDFFMDADRRNLPCGQPADDAQFLLDPAQPVSGAGDPDHDSGGGQLVKSRFSPGLSSSAASLSRLVCSQELRRSRKHRLRRGPRYAMWHAAQDSRHPGPKRAGARMMAGVRSDGHRP